MTVCDLGNVHAAFGVQPLWAFLFICKCALSVFPINLRYQTCQRMYFLPHSLHTYVTC